MTNNCHLNVQQTPAAAAKAADEAIDVAEAANEISRTVADDRAAAEKDFLRGEAEDDRSIQDSNDAVRAEREAKLKDLRAKMESLQADPRNNGGTPDANDFTGDIDELRQATVAAAQRVRPYQLGRMKHSSSSL